MDLIPNAYSPDWFRFFHEGIPASRTEGECGFVRAFCPLPDFGRLLDVCCGMGRHARALAAAGYAITGIERDAEAVRQARALGGGPAYVQCDIRDWRPHPEPWDAVILMSQSFGYFPAQTNQGILRKLGSALRPGGRILLDLWNPDFFRIRQGSRGVDLPGGRVKETKQMSGDRLFVRLEYPGGAAESFEWQTFSTHQIKELASSAGLSLLAGMTDFDAAVVPSPEKPRIQFCLERG